MIIGTILAILAIVFGRKRIKKQIQVPKDVLSKFSINYPNAQNVEWHSYSDDKQFEVSFSNDNAIKGILFDKNWKQL